MLRGECDYIAWEVTREYGDVLPGSTLIYLPGVGHDLLIEDPTVVERVVVPFVLGEDPPDATYSGDTDPALESAG